MNILAIIPARADSSVIQDGKVIEINKKPIISYTIKAALNAKAINRIIVSTDSQMIADIAKQEGAECPFIRSKELTKAGVAQVEVLNNCLDWVNKNEKSTPDYIVLMECTHPLRPKGLISKIIDIASKGSFDSVFPAMEEHASFWHMDDHNVPQRVLLAGEKELMTRNIRKPFYRELLGLGMITKTKFIKEGRLLGDVVGMVPIRDISGVVDMDEPYGITLANSVIAAANQKTEYEGCS